MKGSLRELPHLAGSTLLGLDNEMPFNKILAVNFSIMGKIKLMSFEL